jgi:putative ABC transport system substrate-binding protein
MLGGAVVTWPVLARAQQPAMPVIGFLSSASAKQFATRVAAFRRGLGEIGYVEGQNVAIEYRWAEGNYERLPELAAELAARRVAVIVATGGSPSSVAAKAATTTVPIVFTTGSDPVKTGLVSSFNRPGGNVTGVSLLTTDLTAKRVELLHELVPSAKSIALLVNPKSATAESYERATLAAARGMGLGVSVLRASTRRELDPAFAKLAQERDDALVAGGDAFFESRREEIVGLAARLAVPTMFDTRDYVEAGGLASYGPDYGVAYREAGAYVGRILRGAKPADLPVLQLSRIELVINLKTAKALGLTLSPSLLVRADEVIE